MIIKRFSNKYCLRFIHKEDFVQELKKFADKEDVKNIIVLNGVGMLKDTEIGYFTGKGYKIDKFEQPLELISISGNMFTTVDNQKDWHLHISLGDKGHRMFGGHLINAKVWNTLELFLETIPNAIFRKESEDKKLRLNFYGDSNEYNG